MKNLYLLHKSVTYCLLCGQNDKNIFLHNCKKDGDFCSIGNGM